MATPAPSIDLTSGPAAASTDANGDESGPKGRRSRKAMVKLARPLTQVIRDRLTARTKKLMRKRKRLNKKLVKILERTATTTTIRDAILRFKTLRRMECQARRERRHLIGRHALLKQRQTLYRWDPTDERATDLHLIRSLLEEFKRKAQGLSENEGNGNCASTGQGPNTPGNGNANSKSNGHSQSSESHKLHKDTKQKKSHSEGDESNLRYDQQRVKEMLSGVTYDDLVYDVEPEEGKRVIDHDMWMSGAIDDAPQSPEMTSQNDVSTSDKPDQSASVTTPVNSAMKKDKGSKSSVSGRKVSFQGISDEDDQKTSNGDQLSSPAERSALTKSGKHHSQKSKTPAKGGNSSA